MVKNSVDESGAEAQCLTAETLLRTREYKKAIDAVMQLKSLYPAFNDWVVRGFLALAECYLKLGDEFQAKATLQSIVDNYPPSNITEIAQQRLNGMVKKEIVPDSTGTLKQDSVPPDNH